MMEYTNRVTTIQNLEAQKITLNMVLNQKEAENIVRSFSPIKNLNDERIAEIPVSTVGKIIKHKGYDVSRIINYIPALYETSLLGWSEPEVHQKGHKYHPNIKEYHHYINKFNDGIGEYFIRFTLSEEKAKKVKIGKNYIHSTFISSVTIYKNGDGSQRIRENSPGEASSPPFYDLRLINFFNSVK
ncbi:MAG: hypothetical protein FWD28_10240 [Treponema sp.]|nr:hypothetical protein [Treponema sp.]